MVRGVSVGKTADRLHEEYFTELSRKLVWAVSSATAAMGLPKGFFKSWGSRTADMVLIRLADRLDSEGP